MCGIAGMAGRDGSRIQKDVLSRMTRALKHRGPDDDGIHIMHQPQASVGLGHRRLSIIDLSKAGHQPMRNEDGSLWLTYNGEIYNFKELRKELIASGHEFSSDTDTEAILHGYEQYGVRVLDRLNGMFAFALWDGRKSQLLLARDPFGKKPLYYTTNPAGIVFASELKSLFEHPEVKREIDLRSLSRYLLHEYVPSPHTIVKTICKIPPGHYLIWEPGKIRVEPYWQIRFSREGKSSSLDKAAVQERLIELLRRSISRRLISDVPLGVFLSGGVDSSSIVALMSELVPPQKIKTFSIGFEESSFDESSYARSVASLFGTDHHERTFTPKMMLETLPEIWEQLDEPLADPSILPTYMLSKFTREFVTVALGGDGGDELFAGYDPFLAHKAAELYRYVPDPVHRYIVEPLVRMMPVSTSNMSIDFRMKQFVKGVRFPPEIRNQVWLGSFSAEDQKGLLSRDVYASLQGYEPYEEIRDLCNGVQCRDGIDQMIYLYSRLYLSEDILTKVDRASMANSLEVRAPYLDKEFSEYVFALPSDLKLHRFTRKYILKKALEGKLPREIIHRNKKGFGIPLAGWFKSELKPLLLETFSPARIRSAGIFDVQATQRILDEHFTGRKDNRKQIWTLLMFNMWRDRFSAYC